MFILTSLLCSWALVVYRLINIVAAASSQLHFVFVESCERETYWHRNALLTIPNVIAESSFSRLSVVAWYQHDLTLWPYNLKEKSSSIPCSTWLGPIKNMCQEYMSGFCNPSPVQGANFSGPTKKSPSKLPYDTSCLNDWVPAYTRCRRLQLQRRLIELL